MNRIDKFQCEFFFIFSGNESDRGDNENKSDQEENNDKDGNKDNDKKPKVRKSFGPRVVLNAER